MKDYLMLTTKGEFVELNREDFSDSYEMLRKNVNGYIERVSWLPMKEEDFDYIKSFIQSYIVSFNYFDKPINIFKMLGIEI